MAYIPPHKRNQKKMDNVQSIKKEEFPTLNKMETKKSKMDYSQLFKNVEKKKKLKEKKIKKGWIKLTKEGIEDSLTIQERENEEKYHEEFKKYYNMETMLNRWDKHKQQKLELFGYLSDYSVDSPSEEEEEYYEESEESEEEIEEYDDIFEYKKWFTS